MTAAGIAAKAHFTVMATIRLKGISMSDKTNRPGGADCGTEILDEPPSNSLSIARKGFHSLKPSRYQSVSAVTSTALHIERSWVIV